MKNNNEQDSQSRKFQLTFNNPIEHGWTHEKIIEGYKSLSSGIYFCLSDEIGSQESTYHTHAFIFFENPKLFSTLKNKFPQAHIEAAKGSCKQNRDYVFKEGKWLKTEKESTKITGTQEEIGILPEESQIPVKETEILLQIQDFLDMDMTPKEILAKGISFYKYEKLIRQAYFDRRSLNTPEIRKVMVFYHIGQSGSGKSYTLAKLRQELGAESVYLMTDYSNNGTAGFDGYNGQSILFMDEFKGNLPYHLFLQILDQYKADIHCRYTNTVALWNEVHITSIFPPEDLYRKMVDNSDQKIDTQQQLLRRLSFIVFHYRDNEGYHAFLLDAASYLSYYQLKELVKSNYPPLFKNQEEARHIVDYVEKGIIPIQNMESVLF